MGIKWYNPAMLARMYRSLRNKLERVREARATGQIGGLRYYSSVIGLRILIQLIITPHFMLLGPFKTFTSFARKDEQGTWIDSYDDFIVSNRVSIAGVVSLVLIGILTVLAFIYLPIIYI